jgi:hypothetical protein
VNGMGGSAEVGVSVFAEERGVQMYLRFKGIAYLS